MAPSVQEFFKFEDDYYKICREERNIAAMLYHALLLPDNLIANILTAVRKHPST